MAAGEDAARSRGWRVVIAIVDSGGHLVMLHRLDDANLGAVTIAQRKADTAAKFRRPTKALEDVLVNEGAAGLRMLALSDHLVPVEGGVPLVDGGVLVGAVGVSGMTSAQDGEIAAAAAAAFRPGASS